MVAKGQIFPRGGTIFSGKSVEPDTFFGRQIFLRHRHCYGISTFLAIFENHSCNKNSFLNLVKIFKFMISFSKAIIDVFHRICHHFCCVLKLQISTLKSTHSTTKIRCSAFHIKYSNVFSQYSNLQIQCSFYSNSRVILINYFGQNFYCK